MQKKQLAQLVTAALVTLAANAQAANTWFDTFTPVSSTVTPLTVGDPAELTAPFVLPSNFTQTVIADRNTQLALGQGNSGTWDMIDTNRTGPDAGRYLFIPFETSTGGVQRVDLWDSNYNTRTVTIVAPGTQGFVAGDASRWTPWGTYLTAEESWSDPHQPASPYGRLFEVTDPTSAAANSANFVHRKIGPADIRVSHEGLVFDKHNNFYFIDERNGSHIFRFTSAQPNASNGADFFAAGTISVLRVGDGTTKEATGSYSWIDLTNAVGVPLPNTIIKTDPNGLNILDGRATPNTWQYRATDFDRPEDMEIKTLPNGEQMIFVATTTNHKVFSLDLANNEVKLFASRDTLDGATNAPVGTAFANPDNIAIDAEGNMYIVEDQGNGRANIWFTKDADNDGVAEYMSTWATLRTTGAEPSGLFFHPFDPNVAFVNVQHPSSGNDALVQITAVPEPETYAMMLAGLGLIGLMARHRKTT
ncbi:MAG: alkaline phosphatase PhoX [Thiobacillaceae bacterium]